MTPRVKLTKQSAEAVAREKFQLAGFSMHGVLLKTTEEMDCFQTIFHHSEDAVDLFRVVVNKQTSKIETKRQAKFVPIVDE